MPLGGPLYPVDMTWFSLFTRMQPTDRLRQVALLEASTASDIMYTSILGLAILVTIDEVVQGSIEARGHRHLASVCNDTKHLASRRRKRQLDSVVILL